MVQIRKHGLLPLEFLAKGKPWQKVESKMTTMFSLWMSGRRMRALSVNQKQALTTH